MQSLSAFSLHTFWLTKIALLKLHQWFWIWNIDQNLTVALFTVVFLKLYTILRKKEPTRQGLCKFFLQNVQNKIFKILEMFKTNMKFTKAGCWINSKISNRSKNTILIMFLFCHYCWSLLWCNYWRSLMLGNYISWSRLKFKYCLLFIHVTHFW